MFACLDCAFIGWGWDGDGKANLLLGGVDGVRFDGLLCSRWMTSTNALLVLVMRFHTRMHGRPGSKASCARWRVNFKMRIRFHLDACIYVP